MNKRSTATNGTARSNGIYAEYVHRSNTNNVRQGQGVGPRVRPLSTISPSNVTPHSHQRRWSVDYCKCRSPPVIIVKKSMKEPQPPQRSVSLPHTGSHTSFKRYSCPLIGSFTSPSQSSSSSSSTCSSCSSPPPVKTSVITGPDPLGWKLCPKSSARFHAKRLSLQISIPIIPEPTTPSPEPSTKTKPPLKPKPFRRHHSESSAFLRSLTNPLPAVTLKDLCAVHLRPVTLSDDSDDVFSEETREEEKGSSSRPRKIPPPVPEKTAMARQIAQLIAHSRKRCKPPRAKSKEEENIYTSLRKRMPKYSPKTAGVLPHATEPAGLTRDISCGRKRPTPHFPG
ncbi:mediator of DNA damage checkpoint protein 1-like [Mugil cephalus]|uniref:mediator of DNA damage checkpoint protein 1-like n=1 Tax=Mugil cephalus TaxID=48193 RepID=UPI001FB5FE09|nr:mediator of DNA damage checkpoint protein 1-like [Mugil cephalus]